MHTFAITWASETPALKNVGDHLISKENNNKINKFILIINVIQTDNDG
jgi:hypothetical protein